MSSAGMRGRALSDRALKETLACHEAKLGRTFGLRPIHSISHYLDRHLRLCLFVAISICPFIITICMSESTSMKIPPHCSTFDRPQRNSHNCSTVHETKFCRSQHLCLLCSPPSLERMRLCPKPSLEPGRHCPDQSNGSDPPDAPAGSNNRELPPGVPLQGPGWWRLG